MSKPTSYIQNNFMSSTITKKSMMGSNNTINIVSSSSLPVAKPPTGIIGDKRYSFKK